MIRIANYKFGVCMELIKQQWTKADIKEFEQYLQSFSKGNDKSVWEQRIINTKLPCIAVPSPIVKNISKQIAKGNFTSYLDLWLWNNWTETSIIGNLICKIKDFVTLVRYLDKYSLCCDNWATCDILKFNITDKNKKLYFDLAQKYISSKQCFVRRVGLSILFKYVDDDNYIYKIFDILNSFYDETEYYVLMMLAWLFAECFTKQRNLTIKFLDTHKLNKFVINKGIQKCRDSFRVSKTDKDMLLRYKIK